MSAAVPGENGTTILTGLVGIGLRDGGRRGRDRDQQADGQNDSALHATRSFIAFVDAPARASVNRPSRRKRG